MSLIGFFDRGMSLGPERVAYVQGDESWTFQRGYDVTCRVSNALLAEGLAAETRCAVLAGNSPLAWLCVLGVWRAGLAWVPLNPRSPPADHVQVIGGFDVQALFFQKAFAPAIEMIRAQCPRLRVLVCLDGESPVAQSFEDFWARFPTEA